MSLSKGIRTGFDRLSLNGGIQTSSGRINNCSSQTHINARCNHCNHFMLSHPVKSNPPVGSPRNSAAYSAALR